MAENKEHPLFFTLQSLKDRLGSRQQKNRDELNDVSKRLQDVINKNVDRIDNPEKYENEEPEFMRNLAKEGLTTASQGEVAKDKENDIKASISSSAEQEGHAEKEPVKLLDKKKLRGLKEALGKRVFGQDSVIEEIVNVLKIAALGIKINKEKPAGNYFFAGPSGVGKTELAQTLSATLGVPIIVLKMGEYGLEQDVTKLIGTSPGYVGYQEGGILTNFVKKNPACIVLFDEFEKAHVSADKILLSILDNGMCTDNKGVDVPFKETIVICTSNLGADLEYEEDIDQETKNKYRMEAIKEGIRPEIINRFDSVFHFHSLTKEIYAKIVDKFLVSLDSSIQEAHKISLKYTDKIKEFIVEKALIEQWGRPARRFIEKIVMQPLADYMISEEFDTAISENPEITLDLNKDSNVCFKGKNRKILGVLHNTKELVDRVEENKFTQKKTLDLNN